jgi:NADH:ubiquinone oxidoreductase subunit 6 (subunit J)
MSSRNNDIGDLLFDVIGYTLLSALALPNNLATVVLLKAMISMVQRMKRQM